MIRSCSLVAVIVLAGRVAADPAGAERFERDAEGLAAGGDFLGAAAKYREAFREYPRPDLICNVGVAYYKAKDLPRAHRYLDQCVTTGGSLDKDFISNVKTVLTAVEQNLAAGDFKPLSFIIQPQSATTTFASGIHDESLVGSRQVWVPFGTYQVTIHAEGYADRMLEIVATDRERGEYSIKLEPVAVEPKATKPEVPPDDGLGTPLPPGPATPPAPEPRSLLAPIVASAATGAFGGLAFGFWISSRGQARDAEDINRDGGTFEAYTDAAERAESRQRVSWIAGGVAGVAAITAGVLWWRALRSPSRVEVSASRDGASLSVVGRF